MARSNPMSRALLWSAVLALLAVVATSAAPGAQAYARTRPPGRAQPVRWKQPTIELLLRTRELPAGITRAEVLSALERAAATWSAPNVPCTALTIAARDGDTRAPGGIRDGTNSVAVYARHFCRGGAVSRGNCHDPRRAAVTTTHFTAGHTGDELEIAEADIELNAVSFAWLAGSTRSLDLESALLHEIGHALGLADICVSGAGPSRLRDHLGAALLHCASTGEIARAAVMFPAATHGRAERVRPKRALSADDRAGVCALYPNTSPPPNALPRASAGCSCDAIGVRSAAPLTPWLLALPFSALLLRRRAPSDRDRWSGK
jgi:hypothetical protein